MTSYTAIPNGDIDQDSPITQPLMTALRDNPIAIAEGDASVPANLFPTVLLGTLTTTSGSSHTLSGLDLTGYKFLFLSVNSVSPSTDTYMRWAANNSHRITTTSGGGGVFWAGTIMVDLATSTFSASIGAGSTVASATANAGYAGPCALTNASTSVTISMSC
jgi:hypothetical protein